MQGFFGCFTVLMGAYIVSIDAQRKEKMKVESQSLDLESEGLKENEPKSRIEKLKKAMKGLKGPMYMTGVALSWTLTSVLEKLMVSGENVPALYFFGLQRSFIAIPCLLYAINKRAKFIEQAYYSFLPIISASLLETFTVVMFFTVELIVISGSSDCLCFLRNCCEESG